MSLKGKAAIVTGATSGIGLAAARQLAEEGAHVAVVSRNPDKVARTSEELRRATGSVVVGLVCDVSSELEVERTVDEVLAHFGHFDVVVNNAGMMLFKRLEEFTFEEWQQVFAVDFFGAVFFTRQAMLRMKRGGAIVNVSSIHAEMTTPLVAPYAAAKAAILSLTRSTAIEGADKGIRANAILPGAIDTPMLWGNPNLKSGAEKLDSKDVGQAEDVAAAIAFLASDAARFVTGEAIRVDGGRLARL
jgi:meso-butanediol dehydrogenase / (S,S)-butanediol dehydrogenase / diacetyl reductase